MWEAARIVRCLLEGAFLEGVCRLSVEMLLVEWYRFEVTKGFLVLAR